MKTIFSLPVLFALALLVSSAPTTSHARPEMAAKSAAERFAAMDTNSDSFVSSEEFFAAQPQMREPAFNAIDADGDKRISLAEWEKFTAGHAKGEMGGMMGGMGGGAKGGMGGMMMPPSNSTEQGATGNEPVMPKKHNLVTPKRTQ